MSSQSNNQLSDRVTELIQTETSPARRTRTAHRIAIGVAAYLTVRCGRQSAAEFFYRLADQIVARGTNGR